ncbi:response regulator transcription factor [Brevibacterium sp. ZH18]|uniref:response regulator transcription factor n=1 Tax=Brevibacterium sp. ZH18 TaxID=2927784 RepID=UPI001F61F4A1|nr:response regulator transcription factor [Brevibacterium sp. ZH18]MCI4012417.1 response regulator transcription factor [Brevibacterium sp. ZH18]
MSPKNALVIEDDDDIRRLLEVVLEQSGFSVESVATGALGVDRLPAASLSLITVDLGLPDMSGLDVVEQIRPQTSATIAVISARSSQKDRDASLAAGADAFLTKPFRPRELRQWVRELDEARTFED